jgi:cation/acetate symporter
MFCLMVGTAGLPHLLTRFYTTPTVAEARSSVAWALFFVALLYMSVPALAVLVKYEVMQGLVGSSFGALPPWIIQWGQVDPALLSVSDVNGDGIVQFGEIRLGADIIMLATPEIGGLPYVVSGLVAAGGLAAALSTADGLLLTISNAVVRDIYFHDGRHHVSQERRVILSKFALLVVALLAAMVASLKPADIIPLVSASFSLAASAFVPAMVLGIFWAAPPVPAPSRHGWRGCRSRSTTWSSMRGRPQPDRNRQADLWFGILRSRGFLVWRWVRSSRGIVWCHGSE